MAMQPTTTQRVFAALEHIDPDQLILSTDCGFGRQGCNREIAFFKTAAIAQARNILLEELGFEPDLREYGIGAQILVDLGVKNIRLLTNNPRKIVGVNAYGLKFIERVPLVVGHHDQNAHYLKTKQCRMGHILGDQSHK